MGAGSELLREFILQFHSGPQRISVICTRQSFTLAVDNSTGPDHSPHLNPLNVFVSPLCMRFYSTASNLTVSCNTMWAPFWNTGAIIKTAHFPFSGKMPNHQLGLQPKMLLQLAIQQPLQHKCYRNASEPLCTPLMKNYWTASFNPALNYTTSHFSDFFFLHAL